MELGNKLPRSLATAALLIVMSAAAVAQGGGMFGAGGGEPRGTVQPPPQILKQVGIDQHLDAQLPMDLPLRDEQGRAVKLGDYFGNKPVLFSMVYYQCPMLCGEVLNGMASALATLKFNIGQEFEVVTVSFDPRDTPDMARAKKRVFVERYGRPGAADGWHFLTAPQDSITKLTKTVGFNYAWDVKQQQFAHAAAIMIATPDGKLSKYFYGVEYAPKDLRFGLIQASQHKIGTLVDQVLLYCYHYDPRTGKYGAVISRVIQVAGALTVLLLGGFLIIMFRMEPHHQVVSEKSKRGNA